MEAFRSLALGHSVKSPPDFYVGAGAGKQSPCERSIVETGSPDENWKSSSAMNVTNRAVGIFGEARRRIHVGRIGDVDQMMWNASPLLDRQLVGADVEASINGGGVAVDDFAVQRLRHRQAEGAFP